MPNVFLLDIPARQRQAFTDLLGAPGRASKASRRSSARSRSSWSRSTACRSRRCACRNSAGAFCARGPVTWMADKPADIEVVSGVVVARQRDPQVCVEQEAARILGAKPGSAIDVDRRRTQHQRAGGLRAENGFAAHGRALRILLQSGHAGRVPGHLLRQPAGEARERGGAAARLLRELSHGDGDQCGRRDGHPAAGGGSDRAGDPVSLRLRGAGGRDHSGVSRGRHALPPGARSGDPEDAGRHAAAGGGNLFHRVPGAGNGGGPDGQRAGKRVRGGGAEAADAGGISLRLCART